MLNTLLGRKPPNPPVASDKVQPLHFFENSLLVQGNNMAVSLVFDDVLDAEKLRGALEGLVPRPGWRRLGGRLRRDNVRSDKDFVFAMASRTGDRRSALASWRM